MLHKISFLELSSTQFITLLLELYGGVRMTEIDVAILNYLRDNTMSNNPRISKVFFRLK